MKIRPATLTDTPAIVTLNKISLGYNFPFEATRERVKKILSSPFTKLLVADMNGETVGYVLAVEYPTTYGVESKNVSSLAVLPNFQGRGIGKKLMEAIELWAKETGAQAIRLSSQVKRTDAHRFYQKLGYENYKDQKAFIKYFSETV